MAEWKTKLHRKLKFQRFALKWVLKSFAVKASLSWFLSYRWSDTEVDFSSDETVIGPTFCASHGTTDSNDTVGPRGHFPYVMLSVRP